MLAVLASSLSSGFAGVYYEKLLKESAQPSVVLRNIQLGFFFKLSRFWLFGYKQLLSDLGIFSIIFGAAGVLMNDWDKVAQRGFFDGYTGVVWLVIMLQVHPFLLFLSYQNDLQFKFMFLTGHGRFSCGRSDQIRR